MDIFHGINVFIIKYASCNGLITKRGPGNFTADGDKSLRSYNIIIIILCFYFILFFFSFYILFTSHPYRRLRFEPTAVRTGRRVDDMRVINL